LTLWHRFAYTVRHVYVQSRRRCLLRRGCRPAGCRPIRSEEVGGFCVPSRDGRVGARFDASGGKECASPNSCLPNAIRTAFRSDSQFAARDAGTGALRGSLVWAGRTNLGPPLFALIFRLNAAADRVAPAATRDPDHRARISLAAASPDTRRIFQTLEKRPFEARLWRPNAFALSNGRFVRWDHWGIPSVTTGDWGAGSRRA
jgi:hypothetical protein